MSIDMEHALDHFDALILYTGIILRDCQLNSAIVESKIK